MEKGSNKVGSFLLCSVRDIGQKSYNIAVPRGRGILGGWQLLSGKLRNLGVEPEKGKTSRIYIGEMTKESGR